MALSKCKLNQIPQRNKDLAFGYVHEKAKQNKQSIPEMIKYLCLIYFNPTDSFDPHPSNKKIKVNGNSIIVEADSKQVDNVYLKRIVSSGVHLWKFKYIAYSLWSQILQKLMAKSGGCPVHNTMGAEFKIYDNGIATLLCANCNHAEVERVQLTTREKEEAISMGKHVAYSDLIGIDDAFRRYYEGCEYGFASNGRSTNTVIPTDIMRVPKYGNVWQMGDVIEMKLDFNAKFLKLKINDKDYGVPIRIDPKMSYRAVISFGNHKVRDVNLN